MRVTKRNWTVSIIYFVVVILTLLLRVSFSLGLPTFIPIDSNYLFTLLVQVLIFGIVPFVMYLMSQFNFSDGMLSPIKSLAWRFGFSKKVSFRNWLRTVAITFLMMFTATFVSWMWQSVLSALGFVQVSTPTKYTDIGVLFMQLLMVAVLPAFFEEFTHRGLIFGGFRTNSLKDGWKLVLISALFFSFMHQNIRQTGYTFYDGIILGLLCYYTGSIYPSIFAHFINNAGAVLSEYSNQNGGFYIFNKVYDWLMSSAIGFAIFMLCAVVAFVLIIFLFYRMRKDFIKQHTEIVAKRGVLGGTQYDALLPDKIVRELSGESQTLENIENLDVANEDSETSGVYADNQNVINQELESGHQALERTGEILSLSEALPEDFTKDFDESQRNRKAVWVYVTLGIGVVCAILSFVWGMLR